MRIVKNVPHFTQLEIEDFLNSHDGYEILDAYDIVADQFDSDFLVEDNFREALEVDAIDGDYPFDLLPVSLDLCDIVEAVEKGYIIHE